MTLDQLSAWAAKGESETQEFKLTTGQRSEGHVKFRGVISGA